MEESTTKASSSLDEAERNSKARPPQCDCPEGWVCSTCPAYGEHVAQWKREKLARINRHWRVRLDSEVNPYTIESRYRGRYYLDLDRARSASAILDWIFQIRSLWFCRDPEVISSLLEAIDVLLDPQANFCSWGISGQEEKRISDRAELRRLIKKNWSEFKAAARGTEGRAGV